MRFEVIGGLMALLLIFGPSPGLTVATAQETEQPAAATEQQAEAVSARCSDCHEQSTAFASNPHARGTLDEQGVPNAVCESCHGDGAAHMEGGGDTSLISVPRGVQGADKTCRSCHEEATQTKSHRTGMHANSPNVNCLSCHSIHKSEANSPHLLVRNETALCSSCHGAQAASLRNKPYAHRMGSGAMTCSSCHEPHGRPGKDSLKMTAAGETQPCFSCHADKRGPHVFSHGAGEAGRCASCHEPHGSANPKQLVRSTVRQLCLECHSTIHTDTLGSQPPAFHNLNNNRFANCTTCHVTIHGSNRSPQLLK